ncbi:MAG: ribose 5-phosphate isomerase B [Candidatus Caldatribacteriaceae bacterium]
MRVVLGSDHAGFDLKEKVESYLLSEGYEVEDFGVHVPEPTGVGPIASAVARAILDGRVERGILVCGTGGGMSVMSNRYPGIRAILCFNEFTAEYARRHNDANILVLGSRVIEEKLALRLVSIFLSTPFEGGKYAARLLYLNEVEREAWEILKRRFQD